MFLNLNNKKNKRQFVNRTADVMEAGGLTVRRAEADVDLLSCVTSCLSAMIKPMNAITEDTDNLTLLLHYCEPASQAIYMTSSQRTISINSMKLLVPPVIIKTLLFTHPRTSCDTTARPKGTGKCTVLSKSPQLQEIAEVFMTAGVSKEEIIKRGEES